MNLIDTSVIGSGTCPGQCQERGLALCSLDPSGEWVRCSNTRAEQHQTNVTHWPNLLLASSSLPQSNQMSLPNPVFSLVSVAFVPVTATDCHCLPASSQLLSLQCILGCVFPSVPSPPFSLHHQSRNFLLWSCRCCCPTLSCRANQSVSAI